MRLLVPMRSGIFVDQSCSMSSLALLGALSWANVRSGCPTIQWWEHLGLPQMLEEADFLNRYFKRSRCGRGGTINDCIARKTEADARASRNLFESCHQGRWPTNPEPVYERIIGTPTTRSMAPASKSRGRLAGQLQVPFVCFTETTTDTEIWPWWYFELNSRPVAQGKAATHGGATTTLGSVSRPSMASMDFNK